MITSPSAPVSKVALIWYEGNCVPYVLVEEPVELVIALQVHFLRHVLFDDGLEVFGSGRFAAIGIDEVVHRLLEA